MKVDQPKPTGNVISFQTRSGHGTIATDDERRDNIVRILDLSKFEQPRPAVENGASMRTNIVAMVLLGLLVFLAKEDFSKLERSSLCVIRSECLY
jgi:cold shock CspA family protein